MIVGHSKDIEGIKIQGEGVSNALKKVLVSPKEGWEGWVMRVFELGPDGHTPKHTHNWPHINWIVEGQGTLYLDGTEHSIQAGSYAFVPNNVSHQFKNIGDGKLTFICIVPEEGDV